MFSPILAIVSDSESATPGIRAEKLQHSRVVGVSVRLVGVDVGKVEPVRFAARKQVVEGLQGRRDTHVDLSFDAGMLPKNAGDAYRSLVDITGDDGSVIG